MMGRFFVFFFSFAFYFFFMVIDSWLLTRFVFCMVLVLGEHLGGDGVTRTHWGGRGVGVQWVRGTRYGGH